MHSLVWDFASLITWVFLCNDLNNVDIVANLPQLNVFICAIRKFDATVFPMFFIQRGVEKSILGMQAVSL